MNAKRIAAVILAAFIAFAGYQLLLGDGASPEPSVAGGDGQTTETSNEIRPVTGELGDPVTTTEAPGERIDVEPTAQAEAGQGVTGRIVDANGDPIEGAQVFLMDGVADGRLFARLKLSRDGLNLPPIARMTTDASGEFRLGVRKALADKRYEVRAIHDRYADTVVEAIAITPAAWFDAGDIVMPAGILVTGRVVMAGTPNIPIEGATVQARVLGGMSSLSPLPGREFGIEVLTDASGHFRIENASRGPTSFTAFAPNFARVEHGNVSINGERTHELRFELPRGKSIAGFVTAVDGAPIARANVRAVAISSPEPVWGDAYSDATGRFEIIGLVDGTYSVKARARGHVETSKAPVQAGVGDVQIVLPPQCEARLRVTADGGRLLTTYRASLKRHTPGTGQLGNVPGASPQHVRPRDLVDGTYTFGGIDPGQYVIEVGADGFAKTFSEPFEIVARTASPLIDVAMARGGALRGIVLGDDGRPVAGARVATMANHAADHRLAQLLGSVVPTRITKTTTTTNRRGEFTLDHLAAGTYQLKVTDAEHVEARRKDIEVEEGQPTELDPFQLARGATIRGTVTVDGKPQPHARVAVASRPDPSDPDRPPISAETLTDRDGNFTLETRFPPGRYSGRAARHAPNNPMIQVLDFSRTEQEFELEPGRQSFTLNFNFESTGSIGR